jgi:hypothetical protein
MSILIPLGIIPRGLPRLSFRYSFELESRLLEPWIPDQQTSGMTVVDTPSACSGGTSFFLLKEQETLNFKPLSIYIGNTHSHVHDYVI